MMRSLAVTGAAIGIALAVSAAYARPLRAALDSADEKFLIAAARSGIADVKLGTLAESHAASAAVQQFGRQLVQDRMKANSELMQLALQKGVRLPKDVNSEDKSLYATLSKLHGAAFDKACMEAMVKDRRVEVADFEKEAALAKDADIKAWAAKTLPVLRKQLKSAQEIVAPAPAPAGAKPANAPPRRPKRGKGER